MGRLDAILRSLGALKGCKQLSFRNLREDKYYQVLTLLHSANTLQEPFADCVQCSLKNKSCKVVDLHLYNTMKDKLSVIAENDNDEIVGVILSGILIERDLKENYEYLDQVHTPHIKHMLGAINRHNENGDIFKAFNAKTIGDIRLIAVNADYDYQKVVRELLSRTEAIAEKQHIKVIKADVTSRMNKAILKKCNYRPRHQTLFTPKPGLRLSFAKYNKMQMFYKFLN